MIWYPLYLNDAEREKAKKKKRRPSLPVWNVPAAACVH